MKQPIKISETCLLADAIPSAADEGYFRRDLSPGTAYWMKNSDGVISHLEYVCPCGCGRVRGVTVKQGPKVQHAWQWDGDTVNPTLFPSLQHLEGCRWHGFLTKGVWISC